MTTNDSGAVVTAAVPPPGKGGSRDVSQPRRRGVRRLNPLLVIGGLIIAFLVLVALFPTLFTSQDPARQDVAAQLEPPSAEHWLGRDQFGRDIYARLIYGTQVSMVIGVSSVLLGMAVGVPIGMIAGYFRGKTERVIMWIVDVKMAFPGLVLALLFVALFGQSTWNITLAIVIGIIPVFARLAHGPALAFREREFVKSSIVFGARAPWILYKHIWPNLRSEMVVIASMTAAVTIRIEAGLSFLGLGLPPPTATWGGMLRDGTTYLQTDPLFSLVPGLAIFVAALGFNLLGDGLRDALDPRTANS
ncbi:ABC transporter permease [Streptosporangium carneum]|uniref:Glutathione ABC transporter permease GsiD n=1 Tax=Streptosporangium carneum TaxID=47481 RepID=A0A9W6I1V8_9ACTN|nr:ABC transporter permease [Streptosporangium carneum]GLK10471.1 glutathione ABC transporter permease GsiD [Streptosporangium carneum]